VTEYAHQLLPQHLYNTQQSEDSVQNKTSNTICQWNEHELLPQQRYNTHHSEDNL